MAVKTPAYFLRVCPLLCLSLAAPTRCFVRLIARRISRSRFIARAFRETLDAREEERGREIRALLLLVSPSFLVRPVSRYYNSAERISREPLAN